jgi:hypothetical protein
LTPEERHAADAKEARERQVHDGARRRLMGMKTAPPATVDGGPAPAARRPGDAGNRLYEV